MTAAPLRPLPSESGYDDLPDFSGHFRLKDISPTHVHVVGELVELLATDINQGVRRDISDGPGSNTVSGSAQRAPELFAQVEKERFRNAVVEVVAEGGGKWVAGQFVVVNLVALVRGGELPTLSLDDESDVEHSVNIISITSGRRRLEFL
eukprot:CAMPEP_0175122146 /NCGR_PEP_ID=MMETSP0087-20121206/1561_1 /TAXON_ID=136419 /ORGANISM="Unknown Unknown, Strain D1" /LENGTH=149 /DNA_ID=CAMNT_0016403765 /DNA_START=291 /DNA_END=739 /DNA_ORIENTATION=-